MKLKKQEEHDACMEAIKERKTAFEERRLALKDSRLKQESDKMKVKAGMEMKCKMIEENKFMIMDPSVMDEKGNWDLTRSKILVSRSAPSFHGDV